MATRRPARRRPSYNRRPVRRRPAPRRPARRPRQRQRPATPAQKWIAAAITSVILLAVAPVLGAILLAGLVGFGIYSLRRHNAFAVTRTIRLQHADTYHQMTPKQFEHALADLCRRDGCTRVTVVGGAGDLAADVLATTPDGRRILIQAKRYRRGNSVGSPDVQRVGGTYAVVHRAQLAVVVTTSHFTPAAIAYARQAGIRLFDEHALAAWASQTGPAPWH